MKSGSGLRRERREMAIRFLVLLGPSGSGKSTLGKRLGEELGYDYRDLEAELIAEYGTSRECGFLFARETP
jgi:shikimate kinase